MDRPGLWALWAFVGAGFTWGVSFLSEKKAETVEKTDGPKDSVRSPVADPRGMAAIKGKPIAGAD